MGKIPVRVSRFSAKSAWCRFMIESDGKPTSRHSQIGRSPIIRSFLFVICGWRLKTTQCRMAVARGERTFGEASRAALMAASSFLISLRDCNISLRTSIVSRCLWISASSMAILHGVAGNVIQPIQARWNTTAAHASIGRRHAPDHSLDRAALNGATPKVLR